MSLDDRITDWAIIWVPAMLILLAVLAGGCGEDYSNAGDSPERPLYMVCLP